MMANVYPVTEIGNIANTVLSFTVAQANAIHNNGWEQLIDLEGYTSEDIQSWVETVGRRTAARGGVIIPTVRARRLCALNYWVNRTILRGRPVVAQQFDAAALATAMADYPIMDMTREADDEANRPDDFSYDKWVDWQDSVVTYLKGKKNITKNIPIYYVIRPLNPPANPTEEEEIIFHAPHLGATYQADNRQVHQILTELTNGTDADIWVKQHRRTQDGRAAWTTLCGHYDGPAEGDKRVTVARHDLKIIHYKNESSFSFEKYSSKLKKAFDTLDQYQQPKSEREKVEILLDQINTNDTRLITAIGICRDRHSGTFTNACTYLGQQIAIIYPQHQPNAFGRKGKGGKKPYVRSINSIKTTKGGKTFCNGVDLTDTTKYFSKDDFDKMGKAGREFLNKCPKRKAAKESRNANKKKQKQGTDNNDRQIAAIINGVMQASRHENDSIANSTLPSHIGGTNGSGSARMPQHGPHARAIQSANTSGDTSSQRTPVQYDHNGNIVPQS